MPLDPGAFRDTMIPVQFLRTRKQNKEERTVNSMETIAEPSLREKAAAYIRQYVVITLSISIMSVGVYFFKFPNNFVFGGVTGAAALAAKLTPLSASAFSSAANLILLAVGLIFLGKKFAMTTGYATLVMSIELMVLEKVCPLRGPSERPAHAGSAVCHRTAGHRFGAAVQRGCFLRRHGHHRPHRGKKYTHIHSIATALFLTDLFMVIAACFVFDLYTALYSFVGLTVKSLVIDAVLEKIKMCKAILIICDDKEPICDFVMKTLTRGATYTPCFGAYTDKPHYMIYTTLTRKEADQLQDFIHKQHLNAFMSMLSTTEVFGKGFNHA